MPPRPGVDPLPPKRRFPVQQLSGLDATFLYFETGNAPMHIGGFAIYDPSTMSAPLSYARFLANIERRLHLARCFRQKLVTVPLDLDHPYWVEDENFDLEFHVRHIALPAPGDWRQLCTQVARLHSHPLDLTMPLWEMYLIEGLDRIDGIPKGSFAIVTKIHHAAIDGVSGSELVAAIHDLRPDIQPEPPEKAWVPDRTPSSVQLLAQAAGHNLKQPFRLARVLARSVPAWRRIDHERRSASYEAIGTVPRTRFNGPVSPQRVAGGVVLDLGTIRDIRKTVPGATVNDAILSICGGALRRYLEAKGELPEESLIAAAPISVRSEREAGSGGNRISMMSASVHSEIADPAARLEAVHRGTQSQKKISQAVGASLLTDVTEFLPGMLAELAALAYTRLGLANRISPLFNTVITNVPGPQVPLYSGGARLVANYGMGPILDGMGLIHPIFSYCGEVTLSFTSCREMLPDPEFYEECLHAAYHDLAAATLGSGAPSSARARSGDAA
jgi:diacylglycerol O-acyltransferase / wax synthase